jgi:O-acetyl-ADP-ribose deacetylase (regulator of RNase III)
LTSFALLGAEASLLMIARVGSGAVELVRGDIATQRVDAIVNAANSWLAGGGGVDGAIHRAGGPAIMDETRRRYPDGCPTGDAVASGAGQLAAKCVIHAVGPVYYGRVQDAELLASAYRKSLALAEELACESVALPALSTGAFGYPLADAAPIAIAAAVEHLSAHDSPRLVRFVLFDERAYDAFAVTLGQHVGRETGGIG